MYKVEVAWHFAPEVEVIARWLAMGSIVVGLAGVARPAEPPAVAAPPAEESTAAPPGAAVRATLLPVQLREVAPALGTAIERAAADQLRTIGLFELVAWPVDLPLPPDCLENKRCVQDLGRKLDAAVLFELQAAHSLGGVKFDMRSLSTATGIAVRKAADFSTEDEAECTRVVRWLALKVASPMITTLAQGKGTLVVECPVPDAEIFVNGKSFGFGAGKRFTVSSGVFEIVVNREGYAPYRDLVVVMPDQLRQVDARLEPLVATATGGQDPGAKPGEVAPFLPPKPDKPPPPPPPEGPRFYQTWWFWTAVGVVVAGAGGVTTYLLLRDSGSAGRGGLEVSWP